MIKLIISVLIIFHSLNLYAAQALEISTWDLDAINASRIVYSKNMSINDGNINLYLSPAMTQQHLTFMDHMTFEPLSELLAGELAGMPVYGPEDRYVFITSKDGWISNSCFGVQKSFKLNINT